MNYAKTLIAALFLTLSMLPLLARHHKKSLIKPGVILLLNGTSSAGKSTLVKALHGMYDDFIIAGIDDYARTHPCNGCTGLRYHKFYTNIHEQAVAGKNVIVDTVMYHKKYAKYDAMLQADSVRLIKILVYCPLDFLIAHVIKRNQHHDAREHRNINQAFRAFLGLYSMHTTKKKNSIDTTHSLNMKAILQQAIDTIAHVSKKSKKRLNKTNKKLACKFKLKTPHVVHVAPQRSWDLVVNTSLDTPENLAAQIVDFMKSIRL